MALLNIVWTILNVTLAVTAFIISYRNFRTFSERFGCLPSGLLILAVVSTCSSGKNKDSRGYATASYNYYMSNARLTVPTNQCLLLHDGYLARLEQCVIVSPTNHPDSVKLTSTVTLTGLSMSIRWNPVSTSAKLLPHQRISYQSAVALQWYLLAIPIYTDYQSFSGKIKLGKP